MCIGFLILLELVTLMLKPDLETRIEALEKEVYEVSGSENEPEKRSEPARIRTQDFRPLRAN